MNFLQHTPHLKKFLGEEALQKISEMEALENLFYHQLEEDAFHEGVDLSALAQELILLDLPNLVLALGRYLGNDFPEDNFSLLFSMGNAALLLNEFSIAEMYLFKAHTLQPKEVAPIYNLALIYLKENNFLKACEWARQGLNLEINHFGLWEVYCVGLQELENENAIKKLLELAHDKSSWVGLSLVSELEDPNDALLKLQRLEKLYQPDMQDEPYLLELTGLMGMNGQNENLLKTIWNAKHLGGLKDSWKLSMHEIQAHLAMEQFDVAEKKAKITQTIPGLSSDAKKQIEELMSGIEQQNPQP